MREGREDTMTIKTLKWQPKLGLTDKVLYECYKNEIDGMSAYLLLVYRNLIKLSCSAQLTD